MRTHLLWHKYIIMSLSPWRQRHFLWWNRKYEFWQCECDKQFGNSKKKDKRIKISIDAKTAEQVKRLESVYMTSADEVVRRAVSIAYVTEENYSKGEHNNLLHSS